MRKITYGEAIREATEQMMLKDSKVFVMGQGVWSPWYVGSTCDGLLAKFGKERVIDTPVSEAAITGACVGAAISGSKPIAVHPRMDFMFLALDQIINQAANWRYMFGGKASVPLVVRGIINRKGEQAAQHSQALHSLLSHIPGLKVVMPATPYDAKGLLISAIEDGNPVIYIDDRQLYSQSGDVPEEVYKVPIGKGNILKEGNDVTIAALSYLVPESLKAAEDLGEEGISCEVIDLRSAKPLDANIVLESVKKTKRLVIADPGWMSGGVSAELAKKVYESLFKELKSKIEIVALPDVPAPASSVLEKVYYPDKDNIIKAIKRNKANV